MKRRIPLQVIPFVLALALTAAAAPAAETVSAEPAALLPAGPSVLSGATLMLASGDAVRPSDPAYYVLASGPAPKPDVDMAALQRPFRGMFVYGRTERALFSVNLAAMAALNVADYLSTRECLKQPGLQECNPLMKPFAKNAVLFAAVKAGSAVACHVGLQSLFRRNRTAAWVAGVATNFLLSYAVSNNLRLLGRARG